MKERKSKPGQNQKEVEQTNLLEAAVDVVNMFDQANTGKAIEELGNRGLLLKGAISELRKNLNSDKKRTILDAEQVGE